MTRDSSLWSEPNLSPSVKSVVSSYAARYPWLERQEMVQEAVVAVLEEDPRWRPGAAPRGTSYAALAVGHQLSRFVAGRLSPVQAFGGKFHKATGARSCSLDELHGMTQDRAANSCIDAARVIAEVRRVMDGVSLAARKVLLHEEKPAVVAQELNLPVALVYDETRRARQMLKANRRLQRLAESLYGQA